MVTVKISSIAMPASTPQITMAMTGCKTTSTGDNFRQDGQPYPIWAAISRTEQAADLGGRHTTCAQKVKEHDKAQNHADEQAGRQASPCPAQLPTLGHRFADPSCCESSSDDQIILATHAECMNAMTHAEHSQQLTMPMMFNTKNKDAARATIGAPRNEPPRCSQNSRLTSQ